MEPENIKGAILPRILLGLACLIILSIALYNLSQNLSAQ